MSFRQTREMLLLAYDSKIISDEEFLVLWESCRSKNPDFPHSSYARFDLENIDETECLAEFRVRKQDIPVLANVLQLPVNIRCPQRTICDRIEGLCMLLRRFSYPCRYSDMISRFGRPVPELCMITNILGNPGANSRDDAIFSSKRYFRREFTLSAEEPLGTYSYRTSSRSGRIPFR